MPKSFKEVITALAAKAGVDVKSEDFINTVNAPDFERLTIPDEIYTGIDNGLLNMETAKGNHPEIKRHYYAQAFDGLDKTMISQAQEEKFDEGTLNELKQIQSTPERLKFLTRKLKEHEAKKQTTGKIDKEAWLQEKADMQEQMRLIKEEGPKIKAEYEGLLRNEKMNYAKRQALSRIKTIDDDLDPEVRSAMHDAIINTGLKKMNAKFDVDANGDLVLYDKDGGIVYDEGHRPVNANSFMEKVFADNKRLKVTEPVTTPTAIKYNQPIGQTPTTQEVIPGHKAANSSVMSKNAQALADFDRANAAGF